GRAEHAVEGEADELEPDLFGVGLLGAPQPPLLAPEVDEDAHAEHAHRLELHARGLAAAIDAVRDLGEPRRTVLSQVRARRRRIGAERLIAHRLALRASRPPSSYTAMRPSSTSCRSLSMRPAMPSISALV